MKRLMLVLIVAAAILVPTLAFAGHGDRVIGFEALEGHLEQNRFRVDYEIDRSSWRQLRERGVTPRLNLWVASSRNHSVSFAYSVELAYRSGHFEYPRHVRVQGRSNVAFEVVGYSGDYRVEGISYAGKRAKKLIFEVESRCAHLPGHDSDYSDGHRERYHDHDRRRRQRGSGHSRGRGDHDGYSDHDDHDGYRDHDDRRKRRGGCDIHDHCDGHHDRDQRRRKHPSGHADSRVDVISACEDAVFSSNVSKCVRSASRLESGRQTATIRACDDAFIGSSDILSCIDKARGHYWAPAETIAACDDAFVSSRSALSCIDRTRSSRSRPAPMVAACDSAVIGESDTLACIDESR